MRLSGCALLCLALLFVSHGAAAEPAPSIDVYTMGPGDDLFSRFGHAAICVTDADSPAGRCYNYGTADFSTPGPLTWGIVQGRAWFWVSVVPLPRMLAYYVREDRTVYRQRLPLDEPTARRLVVKLHAADVRSATLYHYHHFNDNCTTRIRDLVDGAIAHSLFTATGRLADVPLRLYVEQGLAGEPGLLALSELVLGRAVDRPSTRWLSMFLPAVMRAELAARLGAPAELVYERAAPLPGQAKSGSIRRPGTWLLAGLGAALALLVLAGAFGRRLRLGLFGPALVLGFAGLLLAGLAALSPLRELRHNEVLLVLWPTDCVLPFLAPHRLRGYAAARLAVLLLCGLAAVAGLLLQPLLGPALLCGLPLAAAMGSGFLVQWRRSSC